MTFDNTILQKYSQALIMYEMAAHGVDPRMTLTGTTFRTDKLEGYKYSVFDNCRKKIREGPPYVEIIMDLLPGANLASYYQKTAIQKTIDKKGSQAFEEGLMDLYEGQDDQKAFEEIVAAIGGSFDVLGFFFFLKDCERYLPIRSRLFDERFSLLGFDSGLEGNCTWAKYLEYIRWIKEIQGYLVKNINPHISLLDAHSFVWILPYLEQYL